MSECCEREYNDDDDDNDEEEKVPLQASERAVYICAFASSVIILFDFFLVCCCLKTALTLGATNKQAITIRHHLKTSETKRRCRSTKPVHLWMSVSRDYIIQNNNLPYIRSFVHSFYDYIIHNSISLLLWLKHSLVSTLAVDYCCSVEKLRFLLLLLLLIRMRLREQHIRIHACCRCCNCRSIY